MVVSTRSRSRLQAQTSENRLRLLRLQQSASISWAEAQRRAAKNGTILKDPCVWRRGRMMTPKQRELYLQALHESEGFDVPDYPKVSEVMLRPCTESFSQNLETYAMEAIRHYKTHVDKNGDPKFVKVVKANFQIWGIRLMFYVTFEAIDQGQLQTYQALISRRLRDITVEFSRLKPTPSSGCLTFETAM